ncbi:copper homeostasis protein CutC [Paenibacillus thermotolerans]|uniref:copper homeostasis protein CutC n=1 Tax=Paenibacillus thermotolerans TaxID=3027807 RepID=UPI0023684105|nr:MULTISPECIES: copper homeostasis protein CutC [unclassified Paenibacillus]
MTDMKYMLEIIATSAADARAAEAGGADRIELVSAISEGGLTPSFGMIEQVVGSVSIPVNVMVRPHSRSFCYDADEIRLMRRDIRVIRELGAAGIVVGGLTRGGAVDTAALAEWLEEAEGVGVTFHRAFDEASNLRDAYNTLARYPGVHRILTSGGKPKAPDAVRELGELASLRRKSAGPAVMAGSGLETSSLYGFVKASGVTEVHLGSGVRNQGSYLEPISEALVAEAKRAFEMAVREQQ